MGTGRVRDMLLRDHGDRSRSSVRSTSRSLLNRGASGVGRGTTVTPSTRRQTRRFLLFVFAAGSLGASIVVFVAGSGQTHNITRQPTPVDSSARAWSVPPTAFQSSPPGDNNDSGSRQGSRSAPGTAPATRGETHEEETQTQGPTGDEEATTPAPPQAVVDVTSRASSGRAHPDKVAVYVYDGIPALDHSDLVACYRENNGGVAPWQDEQADMAQDMGEIWLHRCVWACFRWLRSLLFRRRCRASAGIDCGWYVCESLPCRCTSQYLREHESTMYSRFQRVEFSTLLVHTGLIRRSDVSRVQQQKSSPISAFLTSASTTLFAYVQEKIINNTIKLSCLVNKPCVLGAVCLPPDFSDRSLLFFSCIEKQTDKTST